jgi:hypothetical protein
MLTQIDRVQLVVAARADAAAAFVRLLGAEVVGEDRVQVLAARRTTLRLGASAVELLEPDGSGPVADFLAGTRGGLFAAGLATPDVAALRAHLERRGVSAVDEGGQLFLTPAALGLPGLHVVISADAERVPAGLLRHLYEVTYLVPAVPPATDAAASVFGLAPAHFVPIRSEEFGYAGVLTLFHPDRLDRLEIITPFDATKTMGRFFTRRGPSLYMCFAEADDLPALRARLREYAPADWTGPPDGPLDTLFIHPKALGGMMMGVSRTTFGWTWSGHPERVRPAALG